jgi:prepilin-type N-terminal cleavage/methylation domain-containing protein
MRLSAYSGNGSGRTTFVGLPSVPFSRAAFTLIELILVMAVLTIAASITAPALAHFFRGRTLDSEVRRLLALTREGQSRAVSTGVPVELWFDTPHSSFGLEVELSYESEDPKAVELTMDSDIQLQVLNENSATTSSGSTSAAMQMSRHSNLPKIRFLPDGSIAETSPKTLEFTGRDGNSMWLQQSRNGLSYEIRNKRT